MSSTGPMDVHLWSTSKALTVTHPSAGHFRRFATAQRGDMPHCRPDDVRGGFVLCRCVERADLPCRLDRRHGQNVGEKSYFSCRPQTDLD